MHMELVLAPEDAPELAARVAGIGAPASWRIRRGRGVVTWKSIDGVLTLFAGWARVGECPGAWSRGW